MDKSIAFCVCMNSRKHEIPTEDERISLLAIGIFNGAVAIPTASLNAVIIIAIFNTPSLQKPSFLLLASLALTDFIMGIFGQSLHSAMVLYYRIGYLKTYCYLRSISSFVMVMAAAASIMTVTAIAVDRYLAIRLKMRYRTIVTVTRVKHTLALIWGLSILVSSCPFYIPMATVSIFGVVGVSSCLLITIICYCMSFRALNRHCAQFQVQGAQQPSHPCINITKYKKLLKTMLIVLVFIIICFSFLAITAWLISLQNQRRNVLWGLMSIVGLNSTFDPVIYISRMRDLQKACARVLSHVLPFTSKKNVAREKEEVKKNAETKT